MSRKEISLNVFSFLKRKKYNCTPFEFKFFSFAKLWWALRSRAWRNSSAYIIVKYVYVPCSRDAYRSWHANQLALDCCIIPICIQVSVFYQNKTSIIVLYLIVNNNWLKFDERKSTHQKLTKTVSVCLWLKKPLNIPSKMCEDIPAPRAVFVPLLTVFQVTVLVKATVNHLCTASQTVFKLASVGLWSCVLPQCVFICVMKQVNCPCHLKL